MDLKEKVVVRVFDGKRKVKGEGNEGSFEFRVKENGEGRGN